MNKSKLIILLILVILAGTLFVLYGLNERNFAFNFPRRLLKVSALILVACAIGISSLIFQTLTHNKILTPSVIGLDYLYMFIHTLLIFVLGVGNLTQTSVYSDFLLNCIILIVFAILLYRFVINKAQNNLFLLILVGMICGLFFESMSSFMQAIIDPNEFDILQGKMFASFNAINTHLLFISALIFITLFAFVIFNTKKLDVVLLGNDKAQSLGIDMEKMNFFYLIIVVLLTAISTALVGPVSFLGIITTNIAYQMFKTHKHHILIFAVSLIGALFLISGQFIIERIFEFEITLSIVINFVGGIYFIFLMLRARRD